MSGKFSVSWTSKIDLDHDHLNLKSNNDYIHSLEVTIVQSLVVIKQMVHNILSEQHRNDEQFLTFGPVNLKSIGYIYSL